MDFVLRVKLIRKKKVKMQFIRNNEYSAKKLGVAKSLPAWFIAESEEQQ